MRVCLVGAPSVAEFEDGPKGHTEMLRDIAEHIPLGILSLAGVLEKKGLTPEVVDLNSLFFQYSWRGGNYYRHTEFCSFAVSALSGLEFDVIGFSTMCSSYPLTLRVAREIKRTHPKAIIMLGGPQASVVDRATLDAFSFIDLIVRGEAEETFPRVLGALAAHTERLSEIQGITFRSGGRVIRNTNAPVIPNLDALPLPAFHLLPIPQGVRYIPLEAGRGCPFACTFCSTNDFFRRNFRLKSPEHLIKQMSYLEATWGAKSFDLIHDMFTVDRRRVVEFCQALLESGHSYRWTCSARTDCVDEDLLALMAEAGCVSVFFGVETGSARMQRIIDKHLDIEEAARVVQSAGKHGLEVTISTITGYPQEERDDLRATLHFLMDAIRFSHTDPELNLLAPLAETPIWSQYRDQLVLDDIYSDMSHQGWQQDPADRELIGSHPDIFPNFYGPPSRLDRGYLMELVHFFRAAEARFRWLLVALYQASGDLLDVFDAWRAWRPQPANTSKYYATVEFSRQFQEFLSEVYLRSIHTESTAVAGLLRYQRALEASLERQLLVDEKTQFCSNVEMIATHLEPYPAQGVLMVRTEADLKGILESLRSNKAFESAPKETRIFVTRRCGNDRMDVMAMPPLLAQVMDLCDGTRQVGEIVDWFAENDQESGSITPADACMLALEVLQRERLIRFAAPGGEEDAATVRVDGHSASQSGTGRI